MLRFVFFDRILVTHFQISRWIDCLICSLANRFLWLRLCYNSGQWWIIESTVSDVSSHEVSSLKTCYALMWHTLLSPPCLLLLVPFLATASSCFFLFVTNVTHKGQTVFLHRREHANTKHRRGTRRGRVQRAFFPYFLCEVRKKQGGEGVSMEIGDAVLVPV